MHLAIMDILAVSLIGVVALLFIIYNGIKMHKNKSVSLCNGCSGGSCCTKSFAPAADTKEIRKI